MSKSKKKSVRKRIRALKKHFFLGFIAFFLVYATISIGAVLFVDDFEAYTLNQRIDNQGNWRAGSVLWDSKWFIRDYESRSGSQSVNFRIINEGGGSWIKRTEATTTETGLIAYYKFTGTCGSNEGFYLAVATEGLGYCSTYDYDAENYILNTRYPDNFWHKVELIYDSYPEICKWKVDNEGYTTTTPSPFPSSVNEIRIGATGTGGWNSDCYLFIDDIDIPKIKLVQPEYPIDCERSVVDYNSIVVKGKIKIPIEDVNTYTGLWVNFEELGATSTTRYLFIDLGELKSGEEFNYNTTTTLPLASGYRVYYNLIGYDENGKAISNHHYCSPTFISQTLPLPPEFIEQIGFIEEIEYDECGSLSGAEKWLCEIKNVLKGIFVPSQQKIGELRQNIELLKQKFPINYVSLSKDFFDEVNEGINTTSTIQFKILGNTGNVDFSFWNTTSTIAGTIQQIGGIFNKFLTLIVLLIFIFWSINFIKRILR